MEENKIAAIVSEYCISLTPEGRLKAFAPAGKTQADAAAVIKPNKAAIVAYLKAQAAAEAERSARIKAIEGLAYLNELAKAWDRYHDAWKRYIAGGGLGKAPIKPSQTMTEAAAEYPRAAAYRKAASWEMAANPDKAAAGRRAKERIVNGDNCTDVLADMQAEWSAAANRAVKNQ